jgi:monoamine oxidase
MTARLLEQRTRPTCEVTLFEASGRVGGKLQTQTFTVQRATYEVGVGECYDYEALGPDPLKDLVRSLGLTPKPTQGTAVSLDGQILCDDSDIVRHFGRQTLDAIRKFQRSVRARVSPDQWYAGFGPEDNQRCSARRSCADLLDSVQDSMARRYLQVSMHSDMAAEPHAVNGLIGLRSVLKGQRRYSAQYTLVGGMETLARALAASTARTTVRLALPVVAIGGDDRRGYTVTIRQGRRRESSVFDAVVLAVPYHDLHGIEWGDELLRRAMAAHLAHYDHPGHYLRISLLFERPFWRRHVSSFRMMLDAFGGCCLYDESHSDDGLGVLGLLLAGTGAMTHANADDATLVAKAIDALPDALYGDTSRCLLEGRVHRWVGGVSATPGGWPLRDPDSAHRPEPIAHRGLAVVGDYLFDATLNGLLRSAEISTRLMVEQLSEVSSCQFPVQS